MKAYRIEILTNLSHNARWKSPVMADLDALKLMVIEEVKSSFFDRLPKVQTWIIELDIEHGSEKIVDSGEIRIDSISLSFWTKPVDK